MNQNPIQKSPFHHKGEQDTAWAFWENYRPTEKPDTKSRQGGQDKSWDANVDKVFEFSTQDQFALFWTHGQYNDSSNLIYSSLDETEKRVEREGKQFSIDGINLFRDGIKPAWEDPRNASGYHLQCEQEAMISEKETKLAYKDLWADLVFGLIGEDAEYSEKITGLRYLYKQPKNQLRIELWVETALPDDRNQLSKGGVTPDSADPKYKVFRNQEQWLLQKIKLYRSEKVLKITDHDHRKK